MTPSAPFPARVSSDSTDGPLLQPSQDQQSKSAERETREEARVVFEKTIRGYSRHGISRYGQVGAMFITWEADDMQFKETAVDSLKQLLASDFKFETNSSFELPLNGWETSFQKRLADFFYKYDSPDDLAILYYGGHSFDEDRPISILKYIQEILYLPTCNILVILDCSFSAKSFARWPIGNGYVELLVSAADDARSPAPFLPQSFTSTLYEALKRLLKENPSGFSTSRLYREVYHTMPVTQAPQLPNTKPLHFDQSGNGLGKIQLCPQVLQSHKAEHENEGSAYLKLCFQLNQEPNLAVMNELARHFQYLPCVYAIRFDDLYAPKRQITAFMQVVMQAQKLRPFLRKIHTRRQLRKIAELRVSSDRTEIPSSLLKLNLDQNYSIAYDWSSATRDDDHRAIFSDWSQDLSSGTRPSAPNSGTIDSANEEDRRSGRKHRRSASAEMEHRTSNKAQKFEQSVKIWPPDIPVTAYT